MIVPFRKCTIIARLSAAEGFTLVDFTKFSKPAAQPKPTDPRDIFRLRPAGDDVANDLWQGQAEALKDWYEKKPQNKLILLNTGAGKTYVGLLIAQSLVNQGKRNVLYLCSTIDLILQTEAEAKRLGLSVSLRAKSQFSTISLLKVGPFVLRPIMQL